MMKRLLKDTAIYGSGDFLFKIVAFAVFPIYAHLFTVEEFGIMALVTTLAGFAGLLSNMGLNNAVQRYYWDPKMSKDKRPILVSTGLLILLTWSICVIGGILLVLYLLRGRIEERYSILWAFILLSLVTNIPAQILQYSQDVLRLHFSPWKFTFVSAWRNLFGVLLGLVLIIGFGKGLLGFFEGSFLAFMVSIPIGFWLIRKDLNLHLDIRMAKELILFGYPFIFANVAYWIFESMDRWMLSELSNNTEVGLYSIAFKFATILIFINTAFGQAWAPNAMKLYSDHPNYRWVFGQIFSYLFFALTVIGVIISLFGAEVLRLITPPEYWAAATPLSVLAMSLVLSGTQQITAMGISLERKTYLFPAGTWGTALINIILNWLMIPKLGALGAAFATFISYFVLSGFYLYWTQKLHPIPVETKKIFLSVAIIFLTILFTYYVNRLDWNQEMLISKVVYCFLVIGSGFLFGLIRKSEIRDLVKMRKVDL